MLATILMAAIAMSLPFGDRIGFAGEGYSNVGARENEDYDKEKAGDMLDELIKNESADNPGLSGFESEARFTFKGEKNGDATVTSVRRAYELYGFITYMEYRLEGFQGTLALDISHILKDYSIRENELRVYVEEEGMEPVEARYNVEENLLTLEHDFDKNKIYYVYLVQRGSDTLLGRIVNQWVGNSGKRQLFMSGGADNKDKEEKSGIKSETDRLKALCVYAPFFTSFFGSADIYIATDDISVLNSMMSKVKEEFRNRNDVIPMDDTNIHFVSYESLRFRYGVLRLLMPDAEIPYDLETGEIINGFHYTAQ